MEEHKDFFKWYKTKVTENLQEPPAEVWDNIADELDTNDVWNRVAADLDHRSGWWPKKALYPALAVILLLFVTGGSYYYLQENDRDATTLTLPVDNKVNTQETELPPQRGTNQEKQSTSEARESDEKDQQETTVTVETEKSGSTELPVDEKVNTREKLASAETNLSGTTADRVTAEAGIKSVAQGDYANELANESPPANEPFADNLASTDLPANEFAAGELVGDSMLTTNENTAREPMLEPAQPESKDHSHVVPDSRDDLAIIRSEVVRRLSMPDSMLAVAVEEVAIGPASLNTETQADPPDTFRKAILFGITASAKNTWLLNRQTFTGLEKKTLHTTRPDFGKDLGIVLAYDFSPVFALQAEGHFISEMGQRYKEYRNGKFVERNIDLNYYHTNLLLKYSRDKYRHGFTGNAHALTGGVFYSILKTAREKIDGKLVQADDDYNRDDYGVIAGYEYNQYFAERFELTTGLRMNLGLRDIGTDSWIRTTSGTFSVNVAIKYRLFVE